MTSAQSIAADVQEAWLIIVALICDETLIGSSISLVPRLIFLRQLGSRYL